MNKKYYILYVAIILACLMTVSTQARLGETRAECELRYGKHIAEKGEDGYLTRIYRKGNYGIVVKFMGYYNDKSGLDEFKVNMIVYAKFSEVKSTAFPLQMFSETNQIEMASIEIIKLLESNAGESKWTTTKNGWAREDQQAVATYNEKSLTIATMLYYNMEKKKIEKELTDF